MATAPLLDAAQDSTAIVVAVQKNPGIVLLDTEKFDVFYEKLKADAPVDADVTTNKGREALRKFAANVRSQKAAIDKSRLALTKEWRDMTAQANAAGKIIEQRLEALATEVRQPLTDWEQAENERLSNCRDTIARIRAAANVTIVDTVESVQERGTDIWGIVIDPEVFGDLAAEAQAAKDQTVSVLKEALARLKREAEERAELEKLRAEKEERDRVEAERIAEQERVAAQAEATRVAEERRIAAEKAEAERIARLEREAAERAQREAEAAAEAERQRIQREHEEALAAERARADEVERAAQAERDRIAAEQAEQAKRDADKAHRTAVMKAAKEAIMTCGVDEEVAKKIVLLIRSGEVPNVSLRF
ncbi:conserved hypothetical protein [Sphingobium sp. SYK-6]|uniref:hypothetical protein n=1 Tax=Sphingobium sp. (strain NBRC 103272 / SYK-6) TaxID=627192 RepID=UPI00022770A5|nr:hypothetical protein [Sphingobium sp. SYK-6]BAK66845.1 conserved hypothetical protein [Sphingobium sp. SYK-6]